MEITINKQGHIISMLENEHPMGGFRWTYLKDEGERKCHIIEAPTIIVKEYMDRFYQEGARLSVYNHDKEEVLEIYCRTKDIVQIVGEIATFEKTGAFLVGYNAKSDSYVVGMWFAKNHLREGHYFYHDGELRRMLSIQMSENCLIQEKE